MSKVLVTEQHLMDIASAIREKLDGEDTYRPGDMAAAIREISGYPEPTGTITISQNGTANVKDYAAAAVNVQPVLQQKTATQNGTVTPDTGYDGLSSVVVNVQGGAVDPFSLTEYIASTGTQYIDTGYMLQTNSWVEMVANVTNTSGSPVFFGARDSGSSGQFLFGKSGGKNVLQDGHGSRIYDLPSGSVAQFMGIKSEYILKTDSIQINTDGIDCYGISRSSGAATETYSLYICALNTAGTIQFSTTMKLYRFRIYEGETLVHEFIPWTDEENVVCVKDTVTGTLKYNAGTGAFVRGVDA